MFSPWLERVGGGLRIHLGVLVMLSGGGRGSLGVFGRPGRGLKGIWVGGRGLPSDHSVLRGDSFGLVVACE